MRIERIGLVALFVGAGACEIFSDAYEQGYSDGFACGSARREANAQRQQELNAWADACAAGPAVDPTTRGAADTECLNRGPSSFFVACRDDGLPAGSEPGDCSRFDDGLFGSCPAGVDGVCLCCEQQPARCVETGAACTLDVDCCSGVCSDGDGLCS